MFMPLLLPKIRAEGEPFWGVYALSLLLLAFFAWYLLLQGDTHE